MSSFHNGMLSLTAMEAREIIRLLRTSDQEGAKWGAFALADFLQTTIEKDPFDGRRLTIEVEHPLNKVAPAMPLSAGNQAEIAILLCKMGLDMLNQADHLRHNAQVLKAFMDRTGLSGPSAGAEVREV